MPLLRTSAWRSLIRPRRRSPSPATGPRNPGAAAATRFLPAKRATPGSAVQRKLVSAPVSDTGDAEEDEPEANNSDGDGPTLTAKRRPAPFVDVSNVDSDASGGTQTRARRALQAASRPKAPADGDGPAPTAKRRPAPYVDVSDADSDAVGGTQARARRALQAASQPTAALSPATSGCRGRLRAASPVRALGLLPPSGSVQGRVEAMTRGHMLCRLHGISAPGCGCWRSNCQNNCKAKVREHKAEIATEALKALNCTTIERET